MVMRIPKHPMYQFLKRQIDVHQYKIIVYYNEKALLYFKVSLQPSGFDDILPSFQISNKSEKIPSIIQNEMPMISKWVSDNHTYNTR